MGKDKSDIYAVIEANAIHSLAFKSHFQNMEVPGHIMPGKTSTRCD